MWRQNVSRISFFSTTSIHVLHCAWICFEGLSSTWSKCLRIFARGKHIILDEASNDTRNTVEIEGCSMSDTSCSPIPSTSAGGDNC